MNITESAEKKIEEILQDSERLRVSVNGGGCSGFTVDLSKEIAQSGVDTWSNPNVLIDSTSEEYLSEATLDWKTDDPFNPKFHFSIPNTRSCGCGTSFQFEK
jgi:iron-sulfur cluster assembly accessory protein